MRKSSHHLIIFWGLFGLWGLALGLWSSNRAIAQAAQAQPEFFDCDPPSRIFGRPVARVGANYRLLKRLGDQRELNYVLQTQSASIGASWQDRTVFLPVAGSSEDFQSAGAFRMKVQRYDAPQSRRYKGEIYILDSERFEKQVCWPSQLPENEIGEDETDMDLGL